MDRWQAVATAVMVLTECRDGSAYGQVAGCSYSSNGTAGLIQCRDGSAYGQVAGCSYNRNGTAGLIECRGLLERNFVAYPAVS